MKFRLPVLVVAGVFAAMATPAPVFGQQDEQAPHNHFQFEDVQIQTEQHHPDATGPAGTVAPSPRAKMNMGMMASDAKLDELVKKMNAAQGPAKTDAIAELLTALVQNHRTMCGPMMANMMSMMNMMGRMDGKAAAPAPTDPRK